MAGNILIRCLHLDCAGCCPHCRSGEEEEEEDGGRDDAIVAKAGRAGVSLGHITPRNYLI